MASVESVKAASDVYAPVSGKVVEVNKVSNYLDRRKRVKIRSNFFLVVPPPRKYKNTLHEITKYSINLPPIYPPSPRTIMHI
jgi:hypothetical protein